MKFYKVLLSASAFSILTACGGGSSDAPSAPTDPVTTTETGIFLDSPVINIGYRTETLEGVTNSLGEYKYLAGETVTFFIGDLVFPATAATGTVTPLDLANSVDTSDPKVINMIRLLQTLDKDGNPDNGLTITDAAKSAATQVDFSLSELYFESSTAVTELIPNAGLDDDTVSDLIPTDVAVAHFLESQKLLANGLQGNWFLTGTDLQENHTWDGSVTMNSEGVITSGSMNASIDWKGAIDSGNLNVDGAGKVSGSLIQEGDAYQLTMHMDREKNIIVGEVSADAPVVEDGVYILVKKGSNFSTNDLAGEWFLTGSDLQENHTWDGSVTINSEGVITGGSMNASIGSTWSIDSGELNIDESGQVLGSFVQEGDTYQLTMHMDRGKNIIVGEVNANAPVTEDGVYILVRKGSNFSTNDLAGEWFLTGSDLQENHTWDGSIVMNGEGVITGGSMNASIGSTWSIDSGNLNVSESGKVLGSFIQEGDTYQLTMHMDRGKNIIVGEANADNPVDEDGVYIFVRKQ